MRQAICALAARPMIRNENRVGPDCPDDHGWHLDFRAPSGHDHQIPVLDAMLLGEARMNFDTWLRILIDQRSNPARLCAGQVLAHDAARRQVNRIFLVNGIAGFPIWSKLKVSFTILVKRPPSF